MNIAAAIKRVARGKHGSEHLSQAEACDVFQTLLREDADALQLGAFLIAQRMKGESSAELAGFVQAARSDIDAFGQHRAPDNCVDLPCYAGKCRAPHSYLAAAMQVRDTGIPVFIHGIERIDGRITVGQILHDSGIQRAGSVAEAGAILQHEGIVYADLSELCPALFRIYQLRTRLGVRSFANSVARLLNPMQCQGQLNGFFHTPYADYMAHANRLLGQPRSLVFMGAEGEPELYADRQKLIVKQQGDTLQRVTYPAAGLPTYPRSAADLIQLKQQSCAILADTQPDQRQAAVIQRMLEAFTWAGLGAFPSTWTEEHTS